MDRALGELNEDAAILFDTYLAEHLEAQPWAQDVSAACVQTRAAVDRKTQDTDMEGQPERMPSHRLVRIQWAQVGRRAALVAISIGIGAAVGRWSRPEPVATERVIAQAEPDEETSSPWKRFVSNQRQGFWQGKAVAMLQSRPHLASNSPDAQASLWDKYKSTRKELSHE
jgi:hypothetical protein